MDRTITRLNYNAGIDTVLRYAKQIGLLILCVLPDGASATAEQGVAEVQTRLCIVVS